MRRYLLFPLLTLLPLVARAQEREHRGYSAGSFAATAGLAAVGSAAGTLALAGLLGLQCSGGDCSSLDHAGAMAALSLPFVAAAAGAVAGRALTGGRQHFGRSLLGSVAGMAAGGLILVVGKELAGDRRPIPVVPIVAFFIPVGIGAAWLGR